MSAMKFFREHALLFVVFITGACVLVIEVTAVRILSPYYGNTIFSVSSVISVILGALSVGYYTGGRLADNHPSLRWFFAIIFASGLSVLFLQLLSLTFLPLFGHLLPLTSGPLISAVILFFIPSFLLGMLSPFAMKLQDMRFPNQGIGSIAGAVFFWSTLGSIMGGLLAGFFLIPHFGVNQIIIGTGIVLILLGSIGFQSRIVVFGGIFLTGIVLLFTLLQPAASVLYSRDGVYEKITIFDGEYNERPTRFLLQDRNISGGRNLDGDDLAFDYTQYYALYKTANLNIQEALMIGGGTYSVPSVLIRELPDVRVDVVEIEPSLFKLAKEFFNVPESPRLQNYNEDGRRFLHDTEKTYDFIFSDAYQSLYSIPAHLTTKEFFELAHGKLNNEGIFIGNFIARLIPEHPSFLFSEIKTFQSVFPNSYFFAVQSPNSIDIQNIIFVGYKSDSIVTFENSGFAENLINMKGFDLTSYQKITDNYAPVDYLIAQMLLHEN